MDAGNLQCPHQATRASVTADTTAINRKRLDFSGHDSFWLFGYGSLIYKADFDYLERRPACIEGWERRFWQGSHDHRGTPEAPGRVLTLVPVAGARCRGMAYRISPERLEGLDRREKNGYLRFDTKLHFDDGSQARGLVYIAEADNAAWLGPASDIDIARQIAISSGPSGPNREYLLKLAEALRSMGAHDDHVLAVARALLVLDAG